jgi:hypothetical protein
MQLDRLAVEFGTDVEEGIAEGDTPEDVYTADVCVVVELRSEEGAITDVQVLGSTPNPYTQRGHLLAGYDKLAERA